MASVMWQPYDECICGCGEIHQKAKKNGHVVGCKCRPCIGTRNRRKGRASEARAWKDLGGQGPTRNDDTYHGFPLVVSVENKTGSQIPAKFVSVVDGVWFHDAIRQAIKKTPVGSEAFPAVRMELTPSRAYLVVDISPRTVLPRQDDPR